MTQHIYGREKFENRTSGADKAVHFGRQRATRALRLGNVLKVIQLNLTKAHAISLAGFTFLKLGSALALLVMACVTNAQVYNLGAGSEMNPQTQAKQTKTPGSSLGWGSNIQNARLARAAELALQQGDHVRALDFARRASQAAPGDPQLCFLHGYAARLNGKFQESTDAYSRGLRLSPASLDGLSGLAQTYSEMGRTEDAEHLLKQVITASPTRRNDTLLLGELYLKTANYADAIDWLGKAERISPDARAELLMASAYQHLKQMDKANQFLDLAKKHAPDNPEVQRSMAGYYRTIGNYSDAITALKSIRNPKPDVTAELAYTYQLNGQLDESASIYAQAANTAPKDLQLQLSAAQAAVATGSIESSKPFLERAAAIDGNNYRLHSIRGEIAKIEDHEEDAVREYTVALANLPATPAEGPLYSIQLHMDLVGIYKGADDEVSAHQQLEIAQHEIDALSDVGSSRPQFLRLRALIKMNAGDLEGALRDMKEALAINTHDREALQLDGDILVKLGRAEDAITEFKQILVIDPNNRSALIALGYASRAAGHDQDAEAYFQQLANADPTLYIPYLALGDLYTANHKYDKAQDSYTKAYALAPAKALIVAGGINAAIEAHNLPLAAEWMTHASTQMKRQPQVMREQERYLSLSGNYAESGAVGQEAIKLLPRDRDVVVYLGYDLLHLEKYDELLALTTQYLTIFPKEPDIPLLEGYVHKHQGLQDQARLDFTEALNRDPKVVTAYVNRGFILNDLHQAKPAAADFASALKLEPDNGEAHLGLAFVSLDLQNLQTAIRQADLAERALGDSKDIHVIRATAFERESRPAEAANEYRAALKFTPNDGALYLGLANTLFAERKYNDTLGQLTIADKLSPESASIYALMARTYAKLQNKDQTLRYVELAEQRIQADPAHAGHNGESDLLVATGQALSTLGDQRGAMLRFQKSLTIPNSNRIEIRLAIAQLMAQQGHSEDARRQIALAQMEADAGETVPVVGNQLIAAADIFRVMHDYQLSLTYLERAKAAGASDARVRVGMAENYLALGETLRAEAELAAVKASEDSAFDYEYLLAEANMYRQQHNGAQALTSFAQASDASGDDQAAQRDLLQAGADEGLRVSHVLSLLQDISVSPIFEDTTVYVLDAKLDASFPVSSTNPSLLPPPRSSIESQETSAFHLHFNRLPTTSGFLQVRNTQGQISVPATNSVVNRNTTDYILNLGLNPTINIGHNVLSFDSGIQGTIRRDSESPVAMNQNLFRAFTYLSTSTFFNAVSVKGYAIWETGPYTESNQHSRTLAAAIDFRVGTPWGKTALVTGWGYDDQNFTPMKNEDFFTGSYVGLEHKFSDRLNVRAVVEDLRAWRVVGANSGIAQNLRPAGTVEFTPRRNWNLLLSSAYSSTRSFHVYDAIQNGLVISYAKPIHRKFNDDSGVVVLQYPIRFSAGVQAETFINFTGAQSTQLRPYVRISLF